MTVRARTVHALATLSLGLLLLPSASFAKSSSSASHSSSTSHAGSSSASSSHPSASSAAPSHAISLSKPAMTTGKAPSSVPVRPAVTPAPAPTINLAKTVPTAQPVALAARSAPAVGVAPSLRSTSTVPTVAAPSASRVPVRPVVVSNVSAGNSGNWFGGHYEVFDRPGVGAQRLYRSDSAFSTARWLMDHKAYRTRQVVNAGYELRTTTLVLDQGTPGFDRWIEQNR